MQKEGREKRRVRWREYGAKEIELGAERAAKSNGHKDGRLSQVNLGRIASKKRQMEQKTKRFSGCSILTTAEGQMRL